MTNSRSQFPCRRCFRIVPGAHSLSWMPVSKIGPGIPYTPSSQQTTPPLHTNHAFVVVVIALAVTALICLCTFILLCRRKTSSSGSSQRGRPRPREEDEADEETNVGVPKTGLFGDDDEEGAEKEGGGKRRRGGEVELVVMAGEERPTFLAHPAPAEPAKAKVVGCPPLQL